MGRFLTLPFILPVRLSYAGPYGYALLSSCLSLHSLVSFHENFSLGFRMTISLQFHVVPLPGVEKMRDRRSVARGGRADLNRLSPITPDKNGNENRHNMRENKPSEMSRQT